jgi:hypothetical protein
MWFLHAGGTQSGPLTTDALAAQLAQGSVQPSDWIWRNGLNEWVQVQTVDLSKATGSIASAESTSASPTPRSFRLGRFILPSGYWTSGLAIAALFVASSLVLLNRDLIHHARLSSKAEPTGLIRLC